ncbi:MAG: hypothetical protein H5T66_02530 [Chloroflexi bacterium]|nr:hypothetical protein [Chloroflexota bacterium]
MGLSARPWLHNRPIRWLVWVTVALMMAWATLMVKPSQAEGVVHFLYFSDPRCTSCQETHREVIEPLLAQYGAQIEIEEYDLSTADGLERLIDLEETLREAATAIPAMFKYKCLEHDPEYIAAQYPLAKISRFDVQKSIAMNHCLCIQANVPEVKYLTASSLMILAIPIKRRFEHDCRFAIASWE